MSPTSATAESLWRDVVAVRARSPLVHNITNYVVMNFSANMLLAAGASPVMAHAIEEVDEMVGIAGALVLNIGTLSGPWVKAMQRALTVATQRGIPTVLDPVGAGATYFRELAIASLLAGGPPSIIRGNGSEIMSVAGLDASTKGVDSRASSNEAVVAALRLVGVTGGVVCVSGEDDHVVAHDGRWATLSNGHELMTRVTGVGCSASALIGAFAAVQPDRWHATVASMAYLGVAGEVAAEETLRRSGGPGTFQTALLDATHLLDETAFKARLRLHLHG
jgi:hydroxyethylthiazole kinase